VDAANQAGGRDNITAVFVAGPEYRGKVGTRPGGVAHPRAGPFWTGRRISEDYGLLLGDAAMGSTAHKGMNDERTLVSGVDIIRRLGKTMTDVYLAWTRWKTAGR
jgi:hypothetical protein